MRLRERVNAALFEVIGHCEDKKLRNQLLAARRALFVGDALSLSERRVVASALDGDESLLVEEVIESRRTLILATALFDDLAAEALAAGRRALCQTLSDEDFRKGLLLSSPDLYRNVARYRAAIDAGHLRARDEQIERGLLRYMVRMAMKATPFGTFCGIAPGRVVNASPHESCTEALEFAANPQLKRSTIRLSKGLFAQLWNGVRKHEELSLDLPLEVNPTLSIEAQSARFLSMVEGREVFHQIRVTPGIARIVAAFQTVSLTARQLVALLAQDSVIESSPEEITIFVRSVLQVGLLRHKSPVAEQQAEWLPAFSTALRESHTALGDRIAEELARINAMVADFGVATSDGRLGLYEAMRASALSATTAAGIVAEQPRPLVYEDCACRTVAKIHASRLEEALTSLADWVRLTRPLANVGSAMATARHIFDELYSDSTEVPVVRFYEDYFRRHGKRHFDELAKASRNGDNTYNLANPLGLATIEKRARAFRDLTALVQREWNKDPLAEEIVIAADDVRGICEPFRTAGEHLTRVGVFCHIDDVPSKNAARLVVRRGNYMHGFGKFFSRFVYLFDSEFTEGIREANRFDYGGILAEVCGDAQFNANLHPNLVDAQIAYPTSDRPSATEIIGLDSVVVRRSQDYPNALELIDLRTGKRVLPLDLGFLNIRLRPALFQLLSMFSPAIVFALPLPGSGGIRVGDAKEGGVQYRPRVTFDGNLVLARRQWTVSVGAIPPFDRNEGIGTALRALDKWRDASSIDQEVYYHALPTQRRDNSRGERNDTLPPDAELISPMRAPTGRRGRGRDWSKPQYLNFADPLLVLAFLKQLATVGESSLVFEEMLPSRAGMARFEDRPFATELILEFDVGAQRDK